MALFIDDLRDPPEGRDYDSVARSSDAAIAIMEQDGCPGFISFDHDLGGDDTGMRVVNWMIEKDMDEPGWIPDPFDWNVHSANPIGKENINSKLLCYMKHRVFTEKKRAVIGRINALEKELMYWFDPFITRQQARLDDPDDPLIDWEVDATILAVDGNGDVLYEAIYECSIFCKEMERDLEYLNMNHNEFPLSIPPEQRELHSYLYHELTDHSKQAHIYGASKTDEIVSLAVKLSLYDQFRQQGRDIQGAIRVARGNLSAHSTTRKLLTDDTAIPEVKIAAYMFEDDPDYRPDGVLHYRDIDPVRHPGIEDPYEGVIKYFGLDYEGKMQAEVAARTEILFTDIKSSLTLSFPIQQ